MSTPSTITPMPTPAAAPAPTPARPRPVATPVQPAAAPAPAPATPQVIFVQAPQQSAEAPPEQPDASAPRVRENPSQRGGGQWGWIAAAMAVALLLGFFLFRSGAFEKSEETPAASTALAEEVARLRAELASQNNDTRPSGTSSATSETIPNPSAEEGPLPAAQLEGVVRHAHGAIIKSLGPMETRGGAKYRLLQTTKEPDHTGRHRVLLYPEARPLDEIRRNMKFEGFQPPPGDLVVFDRVNGMHVFAWRLR